LHSPAKTACCSTDDNVFRLYGNKLEQAFVNANLPVMVGCSPSPLLFTDPGSQQSRVHRCVDFLIKHDVP